MSALLRLTLAASLLLLSVGTVVAAHVDPPGKPHLHIDHVPSAMRLIVLSKFSHLFVPGRPSFLDEPPSAGLAAAAMLALLVLALPKIWRPNRLGVAGAVVAAVRPQHASPPSHAPPRRSFSA